MVIQNNKIFLITHLKGNSDNLDDFKIIGVFSSNEEAEEIVVTLRNEPGFIDYPNGFNISPYVLNTNHWEGGFISGFDAVTDE